MHIEFAVLRNSIVLRKCFTIDKKQNPFLTVCATTRNYFEIGNVNSYITKLLMDFRRLKYNNRNTSRLNMVGVNINTFQNAFPWVTRRVRGHHLVWGCPLFLHNDRVEFVLGQNLR